MYTTTVINTKLDLKSTDNEDSCLLAADSAFMDNNPNLPLILTNN